MLRAADLAAEPELGRDVAEARAADGEEQDATTGAPVSSRPSTKPRMAKAMSARNLTPTQSAPRRPPG